MKNFILSSALFVASVFIMDAQVLDFYVCADVNGIDCSTKCNYDKFVSVFGKPDKYEKFGEVEDEEEMSEVYYVGRVILCSKTMVTYIIFQSKTIAFPP